MNLKMFNKPAWIKRRMMQKTRDAELYEMVRMHYDHWLDYSKPKRAMWRMCDAFKAGLQWAVYDTTYQRLVVPTPPPGRVRMVVNKVRPWAMDTEAKMTSQRPTIEVIPNSMQTEDKEAAVVANRACEHFWRVLNCDTSLILLVRGETSFGDMFYELGWNPYIGPRYLVQRIEPVEENGETQYRVMDAQITEPQGDIEGTILTPFNVFHDMRPSNIDAKWWLGTAVWMSCEDIYNRYKVEIEPENVGDYRDDYQARMMTLVGGSGERYSKEFMEDTEGALVFKWWQKPQEGLDKGFYAVVANKKTLEQDVWPKEFAKMDGYPLVQFSWYREPHRPYSQGPIEDQIPICKEINKSISQTIENKDTMANLKWFIPIGGGVKSLDDMAAELVFYTYPLKPEQSDPKPLPAYVQKHIDQMTLHLEDVQLFHKPSKGIVPPGVKSGIALTKLQEQDDRPMSIPEKAIEAGLSSVFEKVLQIVSVMVENDRLITYTGAGQEKSVATFKGADLRDHTNVNIRISTGLSKSRAAETEFLLELYRIGGLRKPSGQLDSARFLELLQFALPGGVFDEENQHRALQREENQLLWGLLDKPPVSQEEFVQRVPKVQLWERHDLHLDEMEKEMNTMRFKRSAERDSSAPFVQGFTIHWQSHVQAMAQAIAPQQSQTAEAPQEEPSAAQQGVE